MASASWPSSMARSASSATYQATAVGPSCSRRCSHACSMLTCVTTSNVRPRASRRWSSANGSSEAPRRPAGLGTPPAIAFTFPEWGVRGAPTGSAAPAPAGSAGVLPYHRVVLARVDMAELIADTEQEILRLVGDRDASTRPLYEMVGYHRGLDGAARDTGKRLRPLLGLLAYASLPGDHRRALPGAAAVELGHNFSLVHDDIEDRDVERRHRATIWTIYGIPQAINAGDTLFVLSRLALHRLTALGFSDAKVLSLMRLYDETCLALCEGQFLDIWASEHAEAWSVELYLEMVGKKTAALIAASVQAGAMLATDDEGLGAA